MCSIFRKPGGAGAAHAITLGYMLATADEREIGRIDGVKGENWLR